MVRFSWIFIVVALGLAACRVPATAPLRFERAAMGTWFVISVDADEVRAGDVEAAADAAFARIAAIDARFSDYRDDSEASRLGRALDRGHAVPVSAEMLALLARARAAWDATGGAFDVSIGAVTKLWRRAARQDELPDAEELRTAAAASGLEHIALDLEASTARSEVVGARFDFGAIAKGYALDEALAVLTQHGFARALVDGGGDLAIGEPPRGRAGWHVEIADPIGAESPPLRRTLSRCGVATSGDLARGFTLDGVRYSHLIDPATGRALTPPVGATAIARDAITADIAASAATVLGLAAFEVFAAAEHGTAIRLVRLTPSGTAIDVSPTFAQDR